MKSRFGLVAIVMVAVMLALVGALRDVGTSRGASPNVPDQPMKPVFSGHTVQGAETTQLGQPLHTFSDSDSAHGGRGAFSTNWSTGTQGNPDIAVDDDSNLGGFTSWSDIQCDAANNTTGIDLFAQTAGGTPWDMKEQDTDLYGNGYGWLVPSTSGFPITARFNTVMTNVWLNGSQEIDLSASPVPVNIITLASNWNPKVGASQIFVSGAPGLPSILCAQNAGGPTFKSTSEVNGALTSPVPITNNPPLRLDTGGPCANCADLKALGLWPSPSIASSGAAITVTGRTANNGPLADPDFKEVWSVQAPTGVTAAWGGTLTKQTNAGGYPAASWASATAPTASVSGNNLSFLDGDAMAKGQTNSYVGSLTLTCSTPGDYIVTIKSMVSPQTGFNDNDLYNNVNLSVIRVKCPAAGSEIDEQAAGLGSTVAGAYGDAIHLAVGNTATAHYEGLLRNQSTTDNVASKGALIAEALGVDNDADYDITLAWLPGTAAAVSGSEPANQTALPAFGAICLLGGGLPCSGLDLTLTEPKGKMIAVSADLQITCDEAGKFLVPVKLVTQPVGYGDSLPMNNAFFNVTTVYCGTIAGDGANDSEGVYPSWTAADSSGNNGDARKPISPTSRPATAIGSDTSWADRYISGTVWYYSTNGATDANASGWIEPEEALAQAPANVDQDEDGLANPAVAQPGQPVDSNDIPNLSDMCPVIVYNAGLQPQPSQTHYSKAADQDCDNLPDGIEEAFGSNPRIADTDDDGATDFVEMFLFTSPVNPDTDGDGFKDKPATTYQNSSTSMDNCPGVFNPTQLNTDGIERVNGPSINGTYASQPNGDKLGDACDTDDDNDSMLDNQENLCTAGPVFSCPPATCFCDLNVGTRPDSTHCQVNTCDPNVADTDGDRQVDGVEVLCGSSPTNPGSRCSSISTSLRAYLRGCHFDLPGNTDFKAFNGDLWVENDPDGDGISCTGGADDDQDNGTFTGAAAPLEINDNIEALGYDTAVARRDTDGDGCDDWLEIMDINGDRVNSVGDLSALAKRGSPSPPAGFGPDPISDQIYDVNKDTLISVGDLSLMARNSCVIKPFGGGCNPQPCGSEN